MSLLYCSYIYACAHSLTHLFSHSLDRPQVMTENNNEMMVNDESRKRKVCSSILILIGHTVVQWSVSSHHRPLTAPCKLLMMISPLPVGGAGWQQSSSHRPTPVQIVPDTTRPSVLLK